MAIKVVKEGILPEDKKECYRGVCANCRCEVQCTGDDLLRAPAYVKPSLRCPTPNCNHYIEVHKTNIRVREAV